MQPIKGGKLRFAAQDVANMMDAADAHANTSRSARSARIDVQSHRGNVYAYNSGATAFGRFAPVGIKANPLTDEYQKQEVLAVEIEAITDAHISEGRWAIIAEPSAEGSVVQAWTSGTFLATVNVTDADHRGVRVTTGGMVSDTANVHGSLLTSSGTGSQLCLVSVAPPADVVLYGQADADWVDDGTDTDNGCYVMVTPVADLDGTALDPEPTDSVKVYLPRSGRREDPNVRSGDVIVFLDAGSEDGDPIGICVTDVLDGKCGESIKLLDSEAPTPDGWEDVSDATKKALVGNEDPTSDGISHGQDTFSATDLGHEPIAIDSSLIADHDIGGVFTESGGPGDQSHTGSLAHERLDHAGTLTHDNVAIPDHAHGLYVDMRQASGLQMEYTAVQSATRGVDGALPTHTHAAHDAYGSISAHNPAAHSAADIGKHTLSDLAHNHKLVYGTTLSHTGSGETSVEHEATDVSKWPPFYAVKVIRRKD